MRGKLRENCECGDLKNQLDRQNHTMQFIHKPPHSPGATKLWAPVINYDENSQFIPVSYIFILSINVNLCKLQGKVLLFL
jgi:hypothetical protein